jgi:hypothetical protein
MLVPESTMKKQISFMVACFFLASMLFFFTSGRTDFAYGIEYPVEHLPFADFEQEYHDAQIRAIHSEVERAAKFRFTEILAAENIFPREIRTTVNISDEHCISISEVRLVFCSYPDDMEVLRDAIRIIQKEVGERTLVVGEFQDERQS